MRQRIRTSCNYIRNVDVADPTDNPEFDITSGNDVSFTFRDMEGTKVKQN